MKTLFFSLLFLFFSSFTFAQTTTKWPDVKAKPTKEDLNSLPDTLVVQVVKVDGVSLAPDAFKFLSVLDYEVQLVSTTSLTPGEVRIGEKTVKSSSIIVHTIRYVRRKD